MVGPNLINPGGITTREIFVLWMPTNLVIHLGCQRLDDPGFNNTRSPKEYVIDSVIANNFAAALPKLTLGTEYYLVWKWYGMSDDKKHGRDVHGDPWDHVPARLMRQDILPD